MRKYFVIIIILETIIIASIILYKELYIYEVITYFPQINDVEEVEHMITTKIKLKDYDIVFYGNQEFYMNYKGKEIELRYSLINKIITIDKIIEQAERDCKNNIAYKGSYLDGGSIEYRYNDFSIIKMKSFNGNRNVYIGDRSLDINNL